MKCVNEGEMLISKSQFEDKLEKEKDINLEHLGFNYNIFIILL